MESVGPIVLFGAGAGFVGSAMGIMIAASRRPTLRSALHSAILSALVGVALMLVARYGYTMAGQDAGISSSPIRRDTMTGS